VSLPHAAWRDVPSSGRGAGLG